MRLAGRPGTVDPRTGNINIKQLSPTERVELIAGLTPLKIAQELSTHENIRNKTTQYQDKRGFYVDKLAQISVGLSDPKLSDSDRAELNLQLFQTQREAQSEGVGSNLALAVKERARAMQLDRLQRDLKQAPKALRPQLRGELGSQ
jgi:hypothetical protein